MLASHHAYCMFSTQFNICSRIFTKEIHLPFISEYHKKVKEK